MSSEEFKVFVRWDDPEEDDEDEKEQFGWVPLIEAFGSMASGDVFQVFLPGASDPLSRGAEEVWVWQKTNGDSGENEVFWDAVGPFTKKDAVRLSRLKASDYIDIDDEALIHGLRRYFQELRRLRAAKRGKGSEEGKEAPNDGRHRRNRIRGRKRKKAVNEVAKGLQIFLKSLRKRRGHQVRGRLGGRAGAGPRSGKR